MAPDPIIVVSVENEILGGGEFWRGPASQIHQCRNLVGQAIAYLTAKDGKPRSDGMWRSRVEEANHG